MRKSAVNEINIQLKADEFVRVITAPHFMALLLASLLYITLGRNAFASPLHYMEAVFTLTLLPMLAYLLCRFVPSLRNRGRKFERGVAIVFSMFGYVLATFFALLGGATEVELTMYFTYLFSGLFTALFSIFGFKASGHACGTSGPAALLTFCASPVYLPLFCLLIPVYKSSLKLKRHTVSQLVVGTVIPIVALAIANIIANKVV